MTCSTPILRAFLTSAALVVAGTATAQDSRSTTDLPIAVQMYTLRDAGTLDEQLAAVQAAGVTAVETVGTQKVSAEELKAALDTYGIRAISTHAQIDDLRSDLQGVIAFNKAIGNDTIIVPHLKPEARPTDAAGWTALGQELRAMSDKLQAADMQLGYHNHDFEMVDMGGKTALEVMMQAAGDDVVAELDLAWVARGGLDPVEYLDRFDGRIFAIHAKDNAPEGEAADEKGFKALGEGVLDFARILPAAEEAGTKWYIIEHDMPKDAAATVKTGAEFLTRNLPEGAARD
ncbi:sugar phosphate isomerase/epimerase family protein [Paracoccus shanxieyensis]|uniref:TIM barrel protein n=1 Tax=Paracoccus shanxieyensis TaxID=2675752 RepID=A0A6L6J3P2_9RHOB|nr:sugar phosphate isomerase/epimerase [Paracoccus shanxieyensis]MTH66501.1 TIM barrel protein [Paracoccus shanxieyensis]MTH89717.1 TIM barrel protein [Paracoccus shanxieyensis]